MLRLQHFFGTLLPLVLLARVLGAVLLFGLPGTVMADTQRTARIELGRSSDTRIIEDTLKGGERVAYLIEAEKGDKLDVQFEARNGNLFFIVTGPGRTGVLHLGATDGRRYRATLPATGDYQVLVQAANGSLGPNKRAEFRVSMRKTVIDKPVPVRPVKPSGGPDEWQVYGLAKGSSLPVRIVPMLLDTSVGLVRNGDIVRNLGCSGTGNDRWCEVQLAKPKATGWVPAIYLRVPKGADPTPPPSNGSYDATGTLSCRPDPAKAETDCNFGIVYGDRRGSAQLYIRLGKNSLRLVRFAEGLPAGTDGRGPLAYEITGRRITVLVGRETYEIERSLIDRR